MGQTYVGRFAPSPTGPLHYGSLVAAVASYLDAKHMNGEWLLRIEDLDPPREIDSAPQQIMHQLAVYGLQWDREVIYQSSRRDAYQQALSLLTRMGKTYACTCSRKQTPPVYPGTCRGQRPDPDQPHAIRLALPDREVSIDDPVAGHCTWALADVGDCIIRRKDGLFAYQLAVVVDDIYQSVTDVVRGMDLLASTPWQLAIYDSLGEARPDYLHIPVLVDSRGDKLSKQSRAKPVSEDAPVPTLRQVLIDLGQDPQYSFASVDEILANAAQQWNRDRIAKTPTITAPAL